LSADICKNIHNPIPKIVLVNAINTLFIQFDSEVYLNDYFDTSTVTVTVTGPQSKYLFDWTLTEEYQVNDPVQVISIEMSFYSSLKGGGSETVQVSFLDSLIYVDRTGNGIITTPLTG
jgi:cellobiose-specific phosphotransferase system component IIB